MKLTIAIAVYNGAKYIDRCLTSIKKALGNHFIDLEILAVNDGSTDNSLQILNKYTNVFTNFKIINKENGGLSSARNTGLEKSSGEYIWFIDVDDEILETSLFTISSRLNSEIIMFNYSEISKNTIKPLYDNILDGNNFTLEDKKDILLNSGGTWRFIFKTFFLKNSNIKFKENMLYEDININSKLFLEAKSISSVDLSIYKYYINDNSIMTNKKLDKKKDIITSLDDIKKYYVSKNKYNKYHIEIEYLYIHHILYVAYLSVLGIDKKSKLLTDFLVHIKKEFPNWEDNKYLKEQNLIKRTTLKYIAKDKRNLVLVIVKFKNILKKFLKK